MVCSVNRKLCLNIFFAFFLAFIPSRENFAQNDPSDKFFRTEFPDIWQRAMTYTLDVAETMPEEFYEFSPTEEQMSFRDHLVHIAGNFYRLTGNVILDDKTVHEEINFDVRSKEEVIRLLKNAFEFVHKSSESIQKEILSETITFGGASMTKERIFYLMRDHCTHHRAVAISYLRIKGIQPPGYRGW